MADYRGTSITGKSDWRLRRVLRVVKLAPKYEGGVRQFFKAWLPRHVVPVSRNLLKALFLGARLICRLLSLPFSLSVSVAAQSLASNSGVVTAPLSTLHEASEFNRLGS